MSRKRVAKKSKTEPEAESRWTRYQDAPDVLQEIATDLRAEHHASLKPATIRVVMVPKAPKVNGQEVAMRITIHNPLTVVTEGVHGTVIVNGDWYDRNDPRQLQLGEEGRNANRQMVARALHEMFCSVRWEGDQLKKQPGVTIYKGVMREYGPLPGTMEEEIAHVLVARATYGIKFLAPLPLADDDEVDAALAAEAKAGGKTDG